MTKKLSPLQAIKAFCRICNNEGQGSHYYDCLNHHCSLYSFKQGKGNYEKGTEQYITQEHLDWLKENGKEHKTNRTRRKLTEGEKIIFRERMLKTREANKKNTS